MGMMGAFFAMSVQQKTVVPETLYLTNTCSHGDSSPNLSFQRMFQKRMLNVKSVYYQLVMKKYLVYMLLLLYYSSASGEHGGNLGGHALY
jgi:hypothetical protein